MGTFLSARNTAQKLIAKKGALVTLSRPKAGSYFDPVTQSEVAAGSDTWTFHAAIFPASTGTIYAARSLELTVTDEAYFAMDNGNVVPMPGDVVTLSGVSYKVKWAKTYDPAADGAIFTEAYLER